MSTKTHEIAADSIAVITWQDDFGMGPEFDRVGKQFRVTELGRELLVPEVVEFRLRDEDDEVHYRGLVRDDDMCENQEILSNWGAADTGGFIIEVKRDGKWTMEIG